MMKRDLIALTDKEYDLVVIGGGSFGAWDASLRGLSVALVEKGDFCGGAPLTLLRWYTGWHSLSSTRRLRPCT
jgi:glycerol-3-phosphate dehydrogenase